MKTKTAAEKGNKGPGQKHQANWNLIRTNIKYLREQGATVVNKHGLPRTVQLARNPGIKILGAADSLIQYGGFVRLYSEEEENRLVNIRGGHNVADL